MQCEEAQELITGLIDGELTGIERSTIDGHLAECAHCKLQFELESALKQNLKQAGAMTTAPLSLRDAIHGRIGRLGANRPKSSRLRYRDWLTFNSLRPIAAFAVVILALATVVFQFASSPDLTGDALAVYQNIASGKMALARIDDAAQLRRNLALTVNNRFAPIPLDMSALQLYPVAGFVQKIAGRDALVTIYEGGGRMITCFSFLGDDSDAPKDAEAMLDPETKINFYSFSRENVNAVLHRVGEVNCLLVANMPLADLLMVARGKSHHA